LDESLAIEGPYMDDAWGRAVPETPENIAQRDKDALTITQQDAEKAQEEARAAAAAERLAVKAEKKRLSVCRNKGISAEDCPYDQG
jgi:hypothetical protein